MQRREDFEYDYYAGRSWGCRRDDQCQGRRRRLPFEVQDYSGDYGWKTEESDRRANRCSWKDSEIRRDMEQFEQIYPELAKEILEEVRQICGSVEGNGCTAYEGQPDRNTLDMLTEQVLNRLKTEKMMYPGTESRNTREQNSRLNTGMSREQDARLNMGMPGEQDARLNMGMPGEQNDRLNMGMPGEQNDRLSIGMPGEQNDRLSIGMSGEQDDIIIRELDEEMDYSGTNDRWGRDGDEQREDDDMVWRSLVEVLICQELARRRARRRMAAQSRRF